MHYGGIEVVIKPTHRWGVDELREFLDKNGEFLVELADNEPEISDFKRVKEIGHDFEFIAGQLRTICEDTEASSEINRLNQEVADLDKDLGRLERENETHESYIGELEDKISSLEEQLANREE